MPDLDQIKQEEQECGSSAGRLAKGRSSNPAGTLSHGQRHETSYAQMVADWLGVPEDKIHLAHADTDEVTIGRGTYASRSMMIEGADDKNCRP